MFERNGDFGMIRFLALLVALEIALTGCASRTETAPAEGETQEIVQSETVPEDSESTDTPEETERTDPVEEKEEAMLKIQIGDTVLTASFADNPSAEALQDLLAEGPVTITVQNYGGFEKVGTLPQSLPRNDEQMTAQPGDIMLYQGNSIVLFHGTNTWSYTRLGTIEETGDVEFSEVLGGADTSMTLSLTS